MKLIDIKGIGSKSLALLKKLEINNVEELVSYYPMRYNIIQKSDLETIQDGDKIVIDGKIITRPIIFRFRKNISKMSFTFQTKTLLCNVIIFNRAFIKDYLTPGKEITIIGKWDKLKNTITASDIKLTPLIKEVTIEPVYHLMSGISSKVLNNYINNALLEEFDILDNIPNELSDKYKFIAKKEALGIIHNPSTINVLKKAQIRLKYEELFNFMLKINYLKLKNEKQSGLERHILIEQIKPFIKSLSFKLTEDQEKACNDILRDMNSSKRMNRLLQGDVGSGKTIVSFIALLINYLSGYQGILMAPTEILANQHYHNIIKMFKDYDIKIELLLGSTSKKEKNRINKELKTGNIDILIGTHAIFQENVEYHSVGLVITDEQHRFGVNQRKNLMNKGHVPDVLYMSATPIPRTYALTIYGDMDVSSIKTLPNGRKEIITKLIANKEIANALKVMYEELKNNHQVYVVAPLIEESEKIDLTNILELEKKFALAFKDQYIIGILHGKMKKEEKDKIMEDFLTNKINVLISTTVIEVGIDVKNATVMVIFDADRFGLSQLHQLRGRIGRNDLESTCFLVCDHEKERLKIMEKTNDGFKISEADFELRGHGDLFGIHQSGDMFFKIADIKRDYKILVQAKEDSYQELMKKELDEKYKRIIKEIESIS